MNRTIEQIISTPLYVTLFPIAAITTQWSMTKEDREVKRLKKATYSEIKEKMLSVKWQFDGSYPTSLFDSTNNNYFHASIFRFGDVGYLLTPYGLLMANILQRKIRKTLVGYNQYEKPYVN